MALLAVMSEKKKITLPRLSSRVPQSFKDRVDDLKTNLQRRRRWFYNGEKLSEEGIVATAVMEFMSLDDDGKAAVLERHIPAIEAMFDAMKEEKAAQEREEVDLIPGERRVTPKPKRKGAV